jgi:hypothetical protein
LSKPVGALNDERLKNFLDRMASFEDPNGEIPKFLYGSHYSSSAAVMFYLLRIEPFTTCHISLQGGKFDISDRQFSSFSSLWNSVSTSTSDVKELIPEFYYFPEFLRNMNKFDLGKTQSGEIVDDVELPPWASSPEEFIKIHREALESDIVSENLHKWIDLIWGFKQQGQEAVKANNLFYYLTYEDAVNIDLVEDPLDRQAIEDQVHHFGQTPQKLFTKPHPNRNPPKVLQEVNVIIKQSVFESSKPLAVFEIGEIPKGGSHLLLATLGEVLSIHSIDFQKEAEYEFIQKDVCESKYRKINIVQTDFHHCLNALEQ